jgi:hypothetical protein
MPRDARQDGLTPPPRLKRLVCESPGLKMPRPRAELALAMARQ